MLKIVVVVLVIIICIFITSKLYEILGTLVAAETKLTEEIVRPHLLFLSKI